MIEQKKRVVTPEEIGRICADFLQGDREIPLIVTGTSMAPFLGDQRDTVFLRKSSGPLRVGDIAFYRRWTGQYVLHRVCKAEGGRYWMIGDGQLEVEPGIRSEQILAVAVRAVRKGKVQKPGCICWDFFAKVWIRLVPARPILQKMYLRVRRKTE